MLSMSDRLGLKSGVHVMTLRSHAELTTASACMLSQLKSSGFPNTSRTLSIVSKCRITLASGAMRSVDAQVCWCSMYGVPVT